MKLNIFKKSKPLEIRIKDSYRIVYRVEAAVWTTVTGETIRDMNDFIRTHCGIRDAVDEKDVYLASGDSLEVSAGPLDLDTATLFKMRFGGKILKGELIWRKID